MSKSYIAPELVELGAVSHLTASFGSSSQLDYIQFIGGTPQPSGTGSFDICEVGATCDFGNLPR